MVAGRKGKLTFCLANPGSITNTTPSMVRDVSAMFVDTTTCENEKTRVKKWSARAVWRDWRDSRMVCYNLIHKTAWKLFESVIQQTIKMHKKHSINTKTSIYLSESSSSGKKKVQITSYKALRNQWSLNIREKNKRGYQRLLWCEPAQRVCRDQCLQAAERAQQSDTTTVSAI